MVKYGRSEVNNVRLRPVIFTENQRSQNSPANVGKVSLSSITNLKVTCNMRYLDFED